MIERLMKFLKKCLKESWKIKTSFAYAGLMLIACILICSLFFASGSNPMKSEEEKQEIAGSVQKGRSTYGVNHLIQGDIVDRNGVRLMYSTAPGEVAQYKDAEAYTQTIGFCNDVADYLLAGGNRSWLYDAQEDSDKGCTIQTTLDSRLQEYSYNKLKTACQGNGTGEQGSIVVLDAKTGQVLTWAFYPSFDVNEMIARYKNARETSQTEYIEEINNCGGVVAEALGSRSSQLVNPGTWGNIFRIAEGIAVPMAVSYGGLDAGAPTWETVVKREMGSTTYPMLNPKVSGSVFKIVTSIAIIEKGSSCLDTPVNDNTPAADNPNKGALYIDGKEVLRNAYGLWGPIGYIDAFVHSVNVYFGQKGIEIGKELLDEVAERCGLDQLFMFDFGRMDSTYAFEEDDLAELARTAIGQQNVQLSAMQVAMLTMGVACDGNIAEPHMIQQIYRMKSQKTAEGTVYTKGDVVQEEQINTEYMNIMDADTAAIIQKAMVATGEDLKGDEYDLIVNGESISIGCKTGTGEIEYANGVKDYNNIWLTSYAPADDPQYVVVVNRYNVDGYGMDLMGDLIDIYEQLFNVNTDADVQETEEESEDV